MAKISIRSDEFRHNIARAIAQTGQIVIWHQLPWSGGMQEWFLIRDMAALDKILDRGQVASAFTAYDWIEVPGMQIVNQAWLEQTSKALAQEADSLMLLIELVTPSNRPDEPIRLTWIGDFEDLQEYAQNHVDAPAIVGHIPSIAGEIIRGYYPDNNGIPKSGPY